MDGGRGQEGSTQGGSTQGGAPGGSTKGEHQGGASGGAPTPPSPAFSQSGPVPDRRAKVNCPRC